MKFNSILNKITEPLPKYRKNIFKMMIIGFLISDDNKCIAGLYRFASVVLYCIASRRRFYEFLNSEKIPFEKIWNVLFKLLGDLIITSGRIILALDDTTYPKSGRKISGCDVHYDHAAKLNSSKYIYGQCRVVLAIQMFIHGRWACLPVKYALYRLKKSVDTKEFKTKIEMAGEMILNFIQKIEKPVLVVTDSWFGNGSLAKELGKSFGRTVHILTRLRIDSSLYGFPEKSKSKKKGRKPKYGAKLPVISENVKSLEQKRDSFFIYGKTRNCNYYEFYCMHKKFKSKVKVVVIALASGRLFPLVSTDCSLTAKQMIEYYSARWKIESGFKELKHELGVIDNQARNRQAVENHFELSMIAMTTAWTYAVKLNKAPERKFKTSKANAYAFADIRRKIKNEQYEKINFDTICSNPIKYVINFFLMQFLEVAE